MGKTYSVGSQAKLCTKCGIREARPDHEWCNECKAETQRRYAADRDEMMERRGYAKGVKALRESLVRTFEGFSPSAVMIPGIVANIIKGQEPMPFEPSKPAEPAVAKTA